MLWKTNEAPEAPYRISVSLRVRHPTADIAKHLEGFGIPAYRSWISGQARTTPSGAPLPGFYDASYWVSEALVAAPENDVTVIASILDEMEKCHHQFQQLDESGGTLSLFVGIFLGQGSGGPSLPAWLLERLANCKLGLELDLYSWDGCPPSAKPERVQ